MIQSDEDRRQVDVDCSGDECHLRSSPARLRQDAPRAAEMRQDALRGQIDGGFRHDESLERLRVIQTSEFLRRPRADERFGLAECLQPLLFAPDEIEGGRQFEAIQIFLVNPPPSLQQLEQRKRR